MQTHGSEIPTLLEETLHGGLGRGVSNELLHSPASVSLRSGALWVVVTHQEG